MTFSINQERALIRALRDAHNAALAAHDIDGIVRLATDDFVMILGGSGSVLNGPAAYRAAVADMIGRPDAMRFERTPDRIEVGDPDGFPVAAESGRWVGTASGGRVTRIAGRYLVHWTKQSGAWRIASETYVEVG